MPDPDFPPPSRAVKLAASYLNPALPATPSLMAILRDRIGREGPLRFTDFMALALYHPELGYYAREPRQVGRGGDFFTSVSVGPLFGELLARRFIGEWKLAGSPARWRIIECGAHDGTLAADILGALAQLKMAAFSAVEYVIPEPLPRLQEAQRRTLTAFGGKVKCINDPGALADDLLPGVAFGNEVLDALPFHIVEWRSGRWQECRIHLHQDGLRWETDHAVQDPDLQTALDRLGNDFPDGYRSEVRTCFRDFLEPLTRCLTSGLLLWPDYGFARPEFYHPARHQGTLRTFSRHRAAEDPLAAVGEIDITAHVDFTAVAEAAMQLGMVPADFRSQGSWLTEAGRDWLLNLEGDPDPAALRQFQTLTHPAHLGASFNVLELSWNQAHPAPAAGVAHRLSLSGPGGPPVEGRLA